MPVIKEAVLQEQLRAKREASSLQKIGIGSPVITRVNGKQVLTDQEALNVSSQRTANIFARANPGKQVTVKLNQESSSSNAYIINGEGYSVSPEKLPLLLNNINKQQQIKNESSSVYTYNNYNNVFYNQQENNRMIQTNKISSLPTSAKKYQEANQVGGFYNPDWNGGNTVEPSINFMSKDVRSVEYNRELARPLFYKTSSSSQTLKSVAPAAAFAVGSVGYGFGTTMQQVYKAPFETIVEAPFVLATNLVSEPKKTASEIGTNIALNPFKFVGEQAAFATTFKIGSGSVVVGKNLWVSKGSYAGDVFGKPIYLFKSKNEIAANKVFDISSLETPSYTRIGGIVDSVESFKSKKGTQIVEGFERVQIKEVVPGKVIKRTETTVSSPDYVAQLVPVKGYSRTYRPVVQTSSRDSLPSLGLVQAQEGSKGFMDLEDAGIYVNPEGRGSGAPLGVGGSSGYSLNPVSSFEGLFSIPTVSKIRVSSVERYPRKIINIPGFGGVNSYGRSRSGEGVAFITKRSELAFGTVQSQSYFNNFFGKVKRETGSNELEAVIPVDSKFSFYKSKDKFTVYQGRSVRIRSGETLLSGKKGVFNADLFEVSSENLKVESQSFSSSLNSGRKAFIDPSRIGSSLRSSKGSLSSGIRGSSILSGSSLLSSNNKVSSVFSESSKVTSSISSVSSKVSSISGISSSSKTSSSVFGSSSRGGGSSSGTGYGFVPIPIKSSVRYVESSKFLKKPLFFGSTKKSTSSKFKDTNLFILPDLSSVSRTEFKLGVGSRYTQPKQTSLIKGLQYKAIRGEGIGFIPTEQLRRKRI